MRAQEISNAYCVTNNPPTWCKTLCCSTQDAVLHNAGCSQPNFSHPGLQPASGDSHCAAALTSGDPAQYMRANCLASSWSLSRTALAISCARTCHTPGVGFFTFTSTCHSSTGWILRFTLNLCALVAACMATTPTPEFHYTSSSRWLSKIAIPAQPTNDDFKNNMCMLCKSLQRVHPSKNGQHAMLRVHAQLQHGHAQAHTTHEAAAATPDIINLRVDESTKAISTTLNLTLLVAGSFLKPAGM